VSAPVPLARLEEIVDHSQVAGRIEALLPIGVRPRQLLARTLLIGMLLTLADHRPAHLTRVHQALTALPYADRIRLGVIAAWKTGPHLLTYRQTERTYGLVAGALEKEHPDGVPSAVLAEIPSALLEASIPDGHKDTTCAWPVGQLSIIYGGLAAIFLQHGKNRVKIGQMKIDAVVPLLAMTIRPSHSACFPATCTAARC